MKKVTDGTAGYYDTVPNYPAERVDEMQERQAKEIEGLVL